MQAALFCNFDPLCMYRNLLGLYFLLPWETIDKTHLQVHKSMVVGMLRYIEREVLEFFSLSSFSLSLSLFLSLSLPFCLSVWLFVCLRMCVRANAAYNTHWNVFVPCHHCPPLWSSSACVWVLACWCVCVCVCGQNNDESLSATQVSESRFAIIC